MVASAHYPDPKTLYDPDPLLKPHIISTYGALFGGASLGSGLYAGFNYTRGRPLKASILMYIPWTLGMAALFEGLSRALKVYYSRRDTIHKHYVLLHPEDFPPPPKIKIGELLEDWNPQR